MSSKTPPLKDNLDLLFTTSTHRRRGLILAFLSGMAGLGAYVTLGALPPYFEATTTLVATPGPLPAEVVEGSRVRRWTPAVSQATSVATDRMETVVERLKLVDRGDFVSPAGLQERLAGLMARLGVAAAPQPPSRQAAALTQLRQVVTATPSPDATSLAIRVRGRDPRLAGQIAQALAALEVESSVKSLTSAAQSELSAIEARVSGLRGEIAGVERALETDAANAAARRPEELARAEAKRGDLQQRARLAREMLTRGQIELLDDIRSMPQIEPLLQQRTRISRQLSELSAAGRADPRRRDDLEVERRAVERRLGEEFGRIVWTLEREAQSATAAVEALKSGPVLPPERIAGLEQERTAKQAEVAGLEAKAERLRTLLAGPVSAPLRVVSAPPQPAPGPWPNTETLAVLVGLGVFIIAGTFIAVREIVTGANQRVRTGQMEGAGLETSSPQVVSLGDAVARILIAAMEKPGFRTLVVGAAPGVSCSAEVKALATMLAEDGRSVLVVDVTRDRIGYRAARGLVDVLQDGDFAGAILANTDTGVQMLGWQGSQTPADVVVDPFGVNQLMDVLDEVYHHVLITGVYADAASFFEMIEGRVDLGFEVGRTHTAMVGPYVRVLGYDVVDLVVLPLAPVGRRFEAGTAKSKRAA